MNCFKNLNSHNPLEKGLIKMSNLQFIVKPSGTMNGTIRVPGDKSISHRSIMFASLAEGVSHVTGFLEGEDSLNTLKIFQKMGVEIDGPSDGKVTIKGVGMRGLKKPSGNLDVGNSGTSMRLLSGIMAAQNFDKVLVGDASLNGRPMKRVTNPLSLMGAQLETNSDGTPPIKITASSKLTGIDYALPMASAQVKSCVLLAGMYADGVTTVTEPAVTRDHTERMLTGFGYKVTTVKNKMSITGGGKLTACDVDVPADISSAAFFMVAASICPGADLILKHVGINATRTGVIDILKLMGANISLFNQQEVGGEPVADIRIKHAQLNGIDIPEHLVPLAIDEFPVLFVAASKAKGTTRLRGAEELRVKESDRIQVMADGLNAIGVDAQATKDGIIIKQSKITGGEVTSHGDHRISMSFAMAGLISSGKIVINDCNNVGTSFPNFIELVSSCGLDIQAKEKSNG